MTRREEPIPGLSAGLSHLMMAGVVVLVALPALQTKPVFQPGPELHAPKQEAPIEPPPAASSPSSPAVVAAPNGKEEWSRDEVARAREQCMHMLSGEPADVEWLEPIRKGDCGLPAPVRLKSVGSDRKVVFDPPVDVNCRLVAALGKWVKGTLQPQARDRMKSPVVRIVGASGYACRNVYNRPNGRLSQHAFANAIDIGGFDLADGRTVAILKGWGLTARDIKAKAKAEADAKAKAMRSAGAVAQTQGGATGSDPTRADKQGKQVALASMRAPQKSLSLQMKFAVTGFPGADAAAASKPTSESQFLRAIHDGACHEFGTVLGPEANDPHRNHFHLDLMPRQGDGYCE